MCLSVTRNVPSRIPMFLASVLFSLGLLSTNRAFSDEVSPGVITVGGHQFHINSEVGYAIAKPLSASVSVRRDTSYEKTDCSKLNERLQRDERNILRCSGSTRPTSVCELFSESLRREVLGIKNDALGTFEPDVVQQWDISPEQLPYVSSPVSEAKIAEQLNISPDQVLIAKLTSAKVTDAGLTIQNSSYLKRLEGAGFSWAKPSAIVVREGLSVRLETANRIVNCELASGLVKIEVQASLEHSYQVPTNQDAWNSEWEVYRELKNALNRPGLSAPKAYVYSGFMLNALAQKHGLDIDEDENFWSVARRLVVLDDQSRDSVSFALRSYANKYSLGRKLPQTDRKVNQLSSSVETPR